MSIDDVIKILADMAVEENDIDRHTAINAGIAALIYMRGKNGQARKSHSEHQESKGTTSAV